MRWRLPSLSVNAVAQNHVAAAFTIDQSAAPGGTRQAMHETAVAGDPCRMELRIAAGQEHRIGIEGRCLVIQGREWHERGAASAPAVEQVTIGEAEGDVAGDGDVLAERRQGIGRRRRGDRAGEGKQGIEVDGLGQWLVAACSTMASISASSSAWTSPRWRDGTSHMRIVHHCTEKGDAARPKCRSDEGTVAIAGKPVDDDAADHDIAAMAGETFDEGGDRLALPRGIDHQHHRQTEPCSKIGGRAAASDRAVEQPHDAFDEDEVGVASRGRGGSPASWRIAQGSRLKQGLPVARFVKAWIEIVGTGLGAGDRDAAPAKRGEESEGDDGLAAAG